MTIQATPHADALVVDPKDDVATALRDLQPGETIFYRCGDGMTALDVLDRVPFGHKIAIRAISDGSHVYKYGEVIGKATSGIGPGRHVHVHNIEGIRGRGDRVNEEVFP